MLAGDGLNSAGRLRGRYDRDAHRYALENLVLCSTRYLQGSYGDRGSGQVRTDIGYGPGYDDSFNCRQIHHLTSGIGSDNTEFYRGRLCSNQWKNVFGEIYDALDIRKIVHPP